MSGEIYHSLCTLLEGNDEDTFKEEMEAFIKLWKINESKLIAYFQNTYASRTGNAVHYVGKVLDIYYRKVGNVLSDVFTWRY